MKNDNKNLRIMIYDKTCKRSIKYLPGLTYSWIAGGVLYSSLKYFEYWKGIATWDEALDYLCSVGSDKKIIEIQFWGHGKWGSVLIDGKSFDIKSLDYSSPFYEKLLTLKKRLIPKESLFWFRTCETFGTEKGQEFAVALSHFLDCKVAGHTCVIGPWQPGLHAIEPGQKPFWSPLEGSPESDTRSSAMVYLSPFRHPRNISCLRVKLPDWAFRE